MSYLNRIGLIDGILSDDVDNFLFGATTVIRNPSNNLSGNRANPILNAAGKDDKNHTRVFRLTDIMSHPEVRLTRGGMILIGLMSGGDYEQSGLQRCGTLIAHGLAKCGFGDTLIQAATTLSRDDLEIFLIDWRRDLCQELRTNSQGYIGKKQPALAKSIPKHFPNVDILLSYTNPVTSESMGKTEKNAQLTWAKEPDLGKLAATCEFYFEWGYKEAIIRRFRTVIWHGAVLRILRRATLDQDAKSNSAPLKPSTPTKSNNRHTRVVDTPSKIIANHFSSMSLGPSEDSEDRPLIIKIHSTRRHVSTDEILEYRLEVAPTQLVRLTESGIKGIRSPEGPDEWASDEHEDRVKGLKKPPPDPDSHLRVWMPAAMVRMVKPDLVEDFESYQGRKHGRKTSKCRPKKNTSGGRGIAEAPDDSIISKECTSASRVRHESSRHVCGDDSHLYDSDDPFQDLPHLHRHSSISQNSYTSSSASESLYNKSPRESSQESSPRNLLPFNTPHVDLRSRSPTPLQPLTLPILHKTEVIEIYDSDEGPLSDIPPLMLARGRARKKKTSSSINSTPLLTNRYKKNIDLIDLT